MQLHITIEQTPTGYQIKVEALGKLFPRSAPKAVPKVRSKVKTRK